MQLCPKGDWRALMEPTRQSARHLAHEGLIDITQKGQVGANAHARCFAELQCTAARWGPSARMKGSTLRWYVSAAVHVHVTDI